MNRCKHLLNSDSMKLLYYAFFHSHLEFSSTFLFSISSKNRQKIATLQKRAIRNLIGLPRFSHTAEAFALLEILPFDTLSVFNVLKFMIKFESRQLVSTFNGDFPKNREINPRILRNHEDYYIPRIRTKKMENMSPFIFSRISNNMKNIIPSYLFGDDYLEELKQNLLE